MLCGKENSEWVMDWFAHQVQHPDVKLYSMLIIVSKVGFGKSYLTRLLELMLDDVLTIRQQQLTKFNALAKTPGLVILEDMGEGSPTQQTSLKTLVSERHLQTTKGDEFVRLPNRANYLGLASWQLNLPFHSDDHRFWIASNYAVKKEGIESAYKISFAEYFAQLYATLDDWDTIKHFLLKRDLTQFEEFIGSPKPQWTKVRDHYIDHFQGGDRY